jgi:hypothetical protein
MLLLACISSEAAERTLRKSVFENDQLDGTSALGAAMSKTVVFTLSLLLVSAATSWAQSTSEESTAEQIGYGTASLVGSAVYFPFKAAFCILGAISSGPTFIIGGPRAATKMISGACRGTWVITPSAVKGQEQIRFIGSPPTSKARKG